MGINGRISVLWKYVKVVRNYDLKLLGQTCVFIFKALNIVTIKK